MSTRAAVGVWTLALFAAAAAAWLVATSDHTDAKLVTILIADPAGLAFVASGLVARAQRPANRTGLLLIGVGFAWFLAALPNANSSWLFSAGLVLNGIWIGLLAHLVLAFPSGLLRSRVDRAIVAAAYVVVGLAAPLGTALFSDEVAGCDGACPQNRLLVASEPAVADAFQAGFAVAGVALLLAIGAQLLRRWRGASAPLRRALAPVFAATGAMLALVAVIAAVGAFSPDLADALNWLVLAALLSVPLAFLYGLLRARFGATARRLLAAVPERADPDALEGALRGVLRDPTLQLGLPLGGSEGFVAPDGRPLALPGAGDGRAATMLGEAVIVHDASLLEQGELLDEAVDAARVVLEHGLSQASLEASERRTRGLLDAIPDAVYRISGDGVVLDGHSHGPNRSGVPARALVGFRGTELLPREQAKAVLDGIRRALETGAPVTVEYRVEGRVARDAEVRLAPTGDDEVVGIFRDVTDRKEQERELRALLEEQAALRRVATLVARSPAPHELREAVTSEVAQLFGAEQALMVRYENGHAAVVGGWAAEGVRVLPPGTALPLDSETTIPAVRSTGKPARLDSYDGIGGGLATTMRELGIRSSIAAPITVERRLWGAVVAARTSGPPFAAGAEHRLGGFAALVAQAIANAESQEAVRTSRARIVEAGDAERRRIERNLHDGAQQRLVTLSLTLRLALARLDDDPVQARALVAAAADELGRALEELRELARGIHPAVLSTHGLGPAVDALAERAPVPVRVTSEGIDGRLPEPVEVAAYFVVAEALANIAKYSDATRAAVRLSRANGAAVVEVDDDGVGGADPGAGSGLRGLADRVEALGGRLELRSDPGRGTLVRAELPLA